MTPINETLFDLLLNALLQIGFFAIVAAIFSRLVAKARAKHQYCFYLAVLLFCLAAPVANTFWHWPSTAVAEKSQQQISSDAGASNRMLWIWQEHTRPTGQFIIPPGFQTWIIGTWAVLVLLRLARFSRAVYRVHRLRRDASILSPAQARIVSQIIDSKYRVAFLESAAIENPVTVGVFRPAILLPSKLLPVLGEQELSAVVAHEFGHIRRRDFLVHALCELISLPPARSQISCAISGVSRVSGGRSMKRNICWTC